MSEREKAGGDEEEKMTGGKGGCQGGSLTVFCVEE